MTNVGFCLKLLEGGVCVIAYVELALFKATTRRQFEE